MRFGWTFLLVPLVAPGCGCGDSKASGDDQIDLPDAGSDADSDSDSDTDADVDAGVDAGIDNGEPSTDFIMDSVLYGNEDDGFDLDGHVTADVEDPVGCGHVDGPDGIDNQLGPVMQDVDELLDVDSEGLLAAAIHGGVLLMLFRLDGLDDRVNDDAVDVQVFNAIDADDPADPSNDMDGEGEFWISPDSVVDGDEGQPKVVFGGGSLTDSVFHGGPVDFSVNLPLGPDVLFPVTLHDAQLVFRLRNATFVEGVVGGTVPVEDIVQAVRDTPDYADQAGFIEIALYSQADMDVIPEGPTPVACISPDDCSRGQDCVDSFCVEPAGHCDALSGAVRITGVRATILGVFSPG
jgi:hypothetical protein